MFLSSFAVLSLRNALGVPSTKVSIDCITFVSYILPSVICYFIAAVLAVTPRTRVFRVALWPPVALLGLRAVLSVDMSLGRLEGQFANIGLVLFMLSAAIRTLDWALAKGPLVRRLRPANGSPSIIMDALDLVSNPRGHGWGWSRGLYIPCKTRPTNRTAFVLCAILSVVVHALICGALHRAVLTLVPIRVGSIPERSTIFDESLPFLVRYFRASIISTFSAFAVYASLQMGYDQFTIPAILILKQDPAQWPPAFEAPWCATSLSDFWGRRWHQWYRRTFLLLGGYPLSHVLGRTGIVIGSFLASAVIHHMMLITLDSRIEIWWMLFGFGMMAPGILAERAFRRLTGRRVCGLVGWMWTMAWLILWGNVIVEGFARAGMFSCTDFADSALPVHLPVEYLVADFDVWLHSV